MLLMAANRLKVVLNSSDHPVQTAGVPLFAALRLYATFRATAEPTINCQNPSF